LMRSLMNYRFENGNLRGHSFGNLFLSALEKVTGSFEKAIEEVSRILSIKGKVIPVTTQQVRLKMVLKNRTMLEGEKEIYLSEEIDQGYESLYLEPYPKANHQAIAEIMNADAIVMGPGGLYTSIISNLLVEGIPEALRETKATIIFVVNLMNRKGQTTGFKVSDYIQEITRFIGEDIFDYILVNDQKPPRELIDKYSSEGDLVENDMLEERVVLASLLGPLENKSSADLMNRSLIRHDSQKLAQELMRIITNVDKNCSLALL